MRYAYAITSALLLGGATATLALQPGTAQVAQNEPGAIQAVAPRAGAPMSFADMVAKLQPAVVNISTKQSITVKQQPNPFSGTPFEGFFGQFGGQAGPQPQKREGASLGSGFLISPDGYIVTNNHVIAPGAQGASVDSITVTLNDRKEYTAKVVGRDETSDLAVLKIDGKNLPFVRFGDSARARPGDWVLAIGQPFGLSSTVTAGIISAIHRVTGQGGANDRFIQTDAAINQGNSGGPMFDMNGNVIGINSQIYSQSGGNIGIGFAIPAEDAKPIVERLMKGQKIERGYLGVQIGGPVNDDVAASLGVPKGQGEIIAKVEPNGPAAKAGLKAFDVVTKVNGQSVTPEQTLSYLIANVPPGGRVQLEVLRGGKPVSLTATAATRPSNEELRSTLGDGSDAFPDDDDDAQTTPAAGGGLGLSVQVLTPAIARAINVDPSTQGVVIAAVDPSSDAAAKLKRGDVITAVNGAPIRTAADLQQVVAAAKAAGRPQVLAQITRGKIAGALIPLRIK
ncbi:Do family serine endopeptidase [Sphingomonas parapaucimobilis]|uniref:Peptidase S1 family protein n=1 Tax=Sphingomonas parapaucimobilis NBRC 15100 TaxID=1219049 RepID=A0A0A1W9Y6_9SPHN|nr:Do family serine endopeptidase [Sphingomonas parapaucimobilis]GAM02042.1 peptidase S1 family protein [Sphingomonas parapaucimobilis NBRC 15100]